MTTMEEQRIYNRIAGKKWRAANKEKTALNNKEYYQNNKESIQKYKKEYREKNKELISLNRKLKYSETYTCECGVSLTKCNKTRHKKTKKHLKYVNIQNNLFLSPLKD